MMTVTEDRTQQRLLRIKNLKRRERNRAKVIVERDKAERARETARQEAIRRVMSGDIASSADTLIGPTPEWLDQGEVTAYVPRQDEGSVRVVTTVRRVQNPYVRQLFRRGKITEDQYLICKWYRMMHEEAGLAGRWSGSRFGSSTVDQAKSRWGTAHLPLNHHEAEAREHFRLARAAITPALVGRFDKVVLHDITLGAAGPTLRIKNRRQYPWFYKILQQLSVIIETHKIDIGGEV